MMFLCLTIEREVGLAVKGQKSRMTKNHYFGIFGLENFIFQKLLDSKQILVKLIVKLAFF